MAHAEPNKTKLNDLLIKRLKAKSYLIWDTYQRGLAIRVKPTGHQAWKCNYTSGGRFPRPALALF
jgi:hypothetical protein